MLNLERQREDRRERFGAESAEASDAGGADTGADYYDVVDNLISSTISSDSEAFIQQIEQENGQ